VVDFDGQAPYNTGDAPLIGPYVTQATVKAMQAPQPLLGYIQKTPADFNNDPLEVRRQVFAEKAWAAVIVNANASALLRQAIAEGNSTYDPNGAAQIITITARQESTSYNYVQPGLSQLTTEITGMFGAMWIPTVLQQISGSSTIAANAAKVPQAINPGMGFTMIDLRPFYNPVATPAVTVGLICKLFLLKP
jgi:Protein of unknown function (DUF3533)